MVELLVVLAILSFFSGGLCAQASIEASLTGAKGDAARGRAIVADRHVGLCLLCHSGPIPEERFQGELAPDLKGAGSRSTEGQLRLRIVDPSRVNPATIMPSYYRTEGLTRVAPGFRGKTVLSAGQIEKPTAIDKMHQRVMEITGDPLPYGIAPNRRVIEELIGHALRQGIITRPVTVDELFEATTRNLVA